LDHNSYQLLCDASAEWASYIRQFSTTTKTLENLKNQIHKIAERIRAKTSSKMSLTTERDVSPGKEEQKKPNNQTEKGKKWNLGDIDEVIKELPEKYETISSKGVSRTPSNDPKNMFHKHSSDPKLVDTQTTKTDRDKSIYPQEYAKKPEKTASILELAKIPHDEDENIDPDETPMKRRKTPSTLAFTKIPVHDSLEDKLKGGKLRDNSLAIESTGGSDKSKNFARGVSFKEIDSDRNSQSSEGANVKSILENKGSIKLMMSPGEFSTRLSKAFKRGVEDEEGSPTPVRDVEEGESNGLKRQISLRKNSGNKKKKTNLHLLTKILLRNMYEELLKKQRFWLYPNSKERIFFEILHLIMITYSSIMLPIIVKALFN